MKNKHLFFAAIMAFAVSFLMTACNKSASVDTTVPTGQQHLSLYLTDGPGLFDKVLIEIKSVKVLVDTSKDTRHHDNDDWDEMGANEHHKSDSSLVWQDLNIKAGIYDILNFRNGLDTLLSATTIPKGAIRMLKIEFGTQNSVVKNATTYPVDLPANSPRYVLIKLRGSECDEYLPGKVRLWLDFDVNRSIVQGRDNEFYLRPVFHFYTISTTGSIAGRVGPKDGYPVITVYNAKDTAYALPNNEGYFKLRGLKDGSYSVFINTSNGYADTTISNVVVTAPKETSVGIIKLHK